MTSQSQTHSPVSLFSLAAQTVFQMDVSATRYLAATLSSLTAAMITMFRMSRWTDHRPLNRIPASGTSRAARLKSRTAISFTRDTTWSSMVVLFGLITTTLTLLYAAGTYRRRLHLLFVLLVITTG